MSGSRNDSVMVYRLDLPWHGGKGFVAERGGGRGWGVLLFLCILSGDYSVIAHSGKEIVFPFIHELFPQVLGFVCGCAACMLVF